MISNKRLVYGGIGSQYESRTFYRNFYYCEIEAIVRILRNVLAEVSGVA